MFTLDRYIAGRFVRALGFAIVTFLVVYIIVHLIEHIDDYIDAHATWTQVVRLYIYFLPDTFSKVIPFSVLLGTLFSVGALSKSNELVAMRASGVSLVRSAVPIMIIGLLISIGTLALNETVLPTANQMYSDLLRFEIEKKDRDHRTIQYHVYRQGYDGRVFRFERYDIPNQRGYVVLAQAFEDSRLTWSLRADEMHWIDSSWLLTDGEWRRFVADDSTVVEPFDSLVIGIWQETPDYFAQRRRDIENMSYFELAHHVAVKEKAGEDATQERFGLQLKLAFPFTCFVMVLLGVPIASTPKRAGLAKSLMISVGVVIVYRVLQEAMKALGNAGDLPPHLAAWGMNALFLAVGVALFLGVRK